MANCTHTIKRMEALLEATPAGMTSNELAEALGYTVAHMRTSCWVAGREGKVKSKQARRQLESRGGNNERLYFAPRHFKADPPAAPRKAKAAAPVRPPAPKPKGGLVLDPQAVATQPADVVPVSAPLFVDRRFTPDRVEPFFSALAPGSYLPSDSAIARAYP